MLCGGIVPVNRFSADLGSDRVYLLQESFPLSLGAAFSSSGKEA